MEIGLGHACDIDQWMRLVGQVRENFPGLETQEALDAHRETVLEFMARDSAICAKSGGTIVGTLLFSREHHMLCFLAVDAAYRRRHIAEQMTACMLTMLGPGTDVTVTTYRDGVPEGAAVRAFYKRLGFVEGRLTEEFGSPVQEFILRRV